MAWQLVGAVLEDHPALPPKEFRVLLALAYAAPIQTRLASPGLPAVMHQADCSRATAFRALRQLEDRALIKQTAKAGPQHNAVYAVLIDPVAAPNGSQPGEPRTGPAQMRPVGPDGSHPDEPRNGSHEPANGSQPGATDGSQPGATPTDSDSYRVAGARPPGRAEPDRDAQPDWRRGRGRALEGRVWPPGSHGAAANPASTPTPPGIHELCPRGCGKAHPYGPCPIDQPDADWRRPRPVPDAAVAKEGAALAARLMAERQRPLDAPPDPVPLTDEQRQAAALAQVEQSRAGRDELPGQTLLEPEPPPLDPADPGPPEPPPDAEPEPVAAAAWPAAEDEPW